MDPWHRPRRHRHAGAGREGAARGGPHPSGARARGVRAPRVGVARALRPHDRRAAQAPRCLLRLHRRALHARRGLPPRGGSGVRRALRAGPDLPRPLHRQLGSRQPLGDLRPRGRGAPRARHAVLDPLRPRRGWRRRPRAGWPNRGCASVSRLRSGPSFFRCRRQRDDRHRASGDDAGRHRGGGAPRGRALPRAGRAHRDPAARRPPPAGDRRRVREDGVRHRPAEGHPRARPQRLRDRPPPRARPGVGDRRGRAHVRGGGRALRRARR